MTSAAKIMLGGVRASSIELGAVSVHTDRLPRIFLRFGAHPLLFSSLLLTSGTTIQIKTVARARTVNYKISSNILYATLSGPAGADRIERPLLNGSFDVSLRTHRAFATAADAECAWVLGIQALRHLYLRIDYPAGTVLRHSCTLEEIL